MKIVNLCELNEDDRQTLFAVLAAVKRGTWNSAKQYRFYRDVLPHVEGGIPTISDLETVEGAEIAFYITGYIIGKGRVNYGRKSRRWAKIVWANSGGILRTDKVLFGYNDKEGSGWIKGVEMGALTPREVSADVAALDAGAEEAARVEAEKKAAAALVVIKEGRQQVSGVVLSFKTTWGQFGSVYKMLIEREDGVKFYGTIPAAINPEKGDTVRFMAAVTPHEPGFAFYSRPTKPEITVRGEEGVKKDEERKAFHNAEAYRREEAQRVAGLVQPVSTMTLAHDRHTDSEGRYNPPDYL